MKIYYYVHTGHRVGLDRFRRAATIIRALGDTDITLLTSDYRIASEAKEHGIKRAVGVDVVQNIPHIANRGDILIYDSDEHNPTTLQDMTEFFSTFIRISDNPEDTKLPGEYLISPYLEGEGICNAVVIDDGYFGDFEKKIDKAFFYGDDDYEKEIEKNLEWFKGEDYELLLGFYYFFGYEEKLSEGFKKIHEYEAYDEVIKHSRILLTSSPQAALENLAAGGCPVFLQRPDQPGDFLTIFDKLNIPIIKNCDKDEQMKVLKNIINKSDLSQKYQKPLRSVQNVTQFINLILDL